MYVQAFGGVLNPLLATSVTNIEHMNPLTSPVHQIDEGKLVTWQGIEGYMR